MKTHLKYALQLKTKEDVEGRGWRLQRGRRKLTWRWKNKCLVKKKKKVYLTMQRQWDTEWILISRPTMSSPYSLQMSLVIALFQEHDFYLKFLGS